MLHVKQPDSRRPRQPQHRQLDQQVGSPADRLGGKQKYGDNEQVGEQDAHMLLPLSPPGRMPVAIRGDFFRLTFEAMGYGLWALGWAIGNLYFPGDFR